MSITEGDVWHGIEVDVEIVCGRPMGGPPQLFCIQVPKDFEEWRVGVQESYAACTKRHIPFTEFSMSERYNLKTLHTAFVNTRQVLRRVDTKRERETGEEVDLVRRDHSIAMINFGSTELGVAVDYKGAVAVLEASDSSPQALLFNLWCAVRQKLHGTRPRETLLGALKATALRHDSRRAGDEHKSASTETPSLPSFDRLEFTLKVLIYQLKGRNTLQREEGGGGAMGRGWE